MNKKLKLFGRFFVSGLAFAVLFITLFVLPISKINAESIPVVTAPTVSSITFTPRTLKLNMTGDDVKDLQIYLNTNGFPLALSGVGSLGHETTTFGPLTKKAVILFQKSNKLTPDGIVGPMTRGIMNSSPIAGQPSILQSTTGCAGTNSFNTITGVSCKTLSILPIGCTSTTNFSTTTGLSCYLPIGCNSFQGYSTKTGFSCVRSGFIVHHDITYSLTYTPGVHGSITGTLSQTVNSGTDGTELTAVPDDGYHFVDWSDLSTTNPRTDINITTNKSVTANFEVDVSDTFTLGITTAGTGSGTTTGAETYSSGTVVTLTNTPDTGSTFGGWSGDEDCTDGSVTVDANKTCTATFTINSYTLTFESNGGSAVTAITEDFGTAISAPTAPTKSGYTFSNWYNEVGLSTIHTFDTMGLTATVYAKWTVASYTVTFNGNGSTGGSTATQSLVYNTATALTTNGFTKTCSSFAGWATTSGGVVEYADGASYTIGAGNVTLYAKWTATPDCYALREIGPGGGRVFYVTNGGLQGLEAAPTDQSTGIIWAVSTPTNYQSTSVPGTLLTIGTGSANTDKIIAQNGGTTPYTYAAGKAKACVGCTLSGWFLPSKDELNKMYINLKKGTDEYGATYTSVGGFASNYYWSSSENYASLAWTQSFTSGSQGGYSKDGTYYVRAVRAFPGTQATPTFSPNSGAITLGVTPITITSAGADTIYYTTDGTIPTTGSSSIASGGTITLSSISNPIKAYAIKSGYIDSAVGTSGTYTEKTYALREIGPGGGYVFYDKGSYSNGWRYLEAAPAPDQSTGIIWAVSTPINYQSTSVTGTSTAIGTGSANTDLIITQNGGTTPYTYAAGKAKACVGCTGSGWFLPSKYELNKMYINLWRGTNDDNAVASYPPVGGFTSSGYWSSSEGSATIAWFQGFDDGSQGYFNKSGTVYVRAVRAF